MDIDTAIIERKSHELKDQAKIYFKNYMNFVVNHKEGTRVKELKF